MHKPSLNHSYRLIWSAIHSAFVAVAENVRGKGKSSTVVSGAEVTPSQETRMFKLKAVTVALLVLSYGGPVIAELPTGGVVVSGSATFAESGNNLNINQTSNTVYSNWNTFNIGVSNAVNITQPSASATFLANILSPDVTKIQGQLNANGQVFLINPNGILFSPTAQINVGGLVASTLNLSVSDFNAGNYSFNGASSNAIINQGNIIAANGGTIALIAAKVSNTGTIVATAGNVLIGAGSKVTLDLGGPVKLQVEQGAIDALIANGGAIQADGGYIYLTASAANNLATTVINNTGLIEAQTLATGEKGEIYLMGDMQKGIVEVGGIIDASAPNNGNGGFVETSGAVVNIANDAKVTTASAEGETGTWLIDPLDYYIAATGGNMTGAQVSTALASNNLIIQTTNNSGTENGDIFVNDTVTWSQNKLTLSAYRNIDINTAMQGSNTAKLALEYGQGAIASPRNNAIYNVKAPINLGAGNNFSTKLGSDGDVINYNVITSASALQDIDSWINSSLNGNYALGSNIDASDISNFNPIGVDFAFLGYATFNGAFDGLGHTVSNLNINRANTNNVGLFGINNGVIRNVGVVSGSIVGSTNVGALAGINNGQIINSYAFTNVTGGNNVGGLVGTNNGSIESSFSNGSVTSSSGTGNFILRNTSNAGGLVGLNTGDITDTYATGNVNLVRDNYETNNIGGLVGRNEGDINTSYASGRVIATNGRAGLFGFTPDRNNNFGGLVGSASGGASVNNSYWNTTTSNIANSAGGIGVSSANFMKATSFTGFSTDNSWYIQEGKTAPLLRAFLKPLTVSVDNISKVYDGVVFNSQAADVKYSIAGANIGAVTFAGDAQGARNAGTYDIEVQSDYTTTQFGYIVSTKDAELNIDKRDISVSGITANDKTYDGNTLATLNFDAPNFNNLVTGDEINIDSVTGNFVNKNAGINKTVYLTTASYSGADLGNYNITDQTTTTADIGKASLTIIADDKSKTYGDNNPNFTVSYDGFVDGETFASSDLRGTVVAGVGLIPSLLNRNLDAGEYTIGLLPIFLRSNNYDINYQTGKLTVDQALVTVTGDSYTNTYGDGVPSLDVTYAGFKNGQNENSRGVIRSGDVDISLTQGGNIITTDEPNAGNYVVDVSGDLNAKNYKFTYVDGDFTVDKAKLSVTFNDQQLTYGDAFFFPLFTDVTYDGFVYDQDYASSDLRGTAVGVANVSFLSNAGDYAINRSRLLTSLRSDNYDISFERGNLEIQKANLTVDVIDQTRQYGDANQSFVYTYSGFKNRQSARSLGLNENVEYETDATNTSDVGTYTIKATDDTQALILRNYNLIFNEGNLDVTPREISITGLDFTKLFGATDPVFGFTVGGRGLVNGDKLSGLLSRVTGELSGNYLINGSTLSNSNYVITDFTPGELTILGIGQTQDDAITNAQNGSRTSGTPSNTTVSYVDINNAPTASGGEDGEEEEEGNLDIFFIGNGVSGPL